MSLTSWLPGLGRGAISEHSSPLECGPDPRRHPRNLAVQGGIKHAPQAVDGAPPLGRGECMTNNARTPEALAARLTPLLIAATRVASTVAQGVHGRRRVGQGDSFWQFRRFVTGDPFARVDWRQSAKSGRGAPEGWFIRETEWEAAQTVCLWRDASSSMRWRSGGATVEKRERAGLLLLALASLLLRGGERVAMIEPGARAISGRVGLDRLAEALAGVVDENAGVPP